MKYLNEKELNHFKKEVKAACAKIGMEPNGESDRGLSFEKYFHAFATVALTIDPGTGKLIVECYYDSEIVNESLQVTEVYDFKKLDKAIEKCAKLLRSVNGDEPIFGGIE